MDDSKLPTSRHRALALVPIASALVLAGATYLYAAPLRPPAAPPSAAAALWLCVLAGVAGALTSAAGVLVCRRALARHESADRTALERIAAQNELLGRQAAELEHLNAVLQERTEQAEREQERAELARRGTDEILGSISDAFFALDAEWRLTWINSQAEALFTVRRHEVVGRQIWRAFRLSGTAVERALHEAVRTREVVRFEDYHRGGFYAGAVYPSEGGISVFLTDVTEMRAAEARFRAMAEAMPQMVWSAGRDGALDYCNERFLAYTGMPRDLPDGMVWASVHPDDVPRVHATWRQTLRTGAHFELNLRMRNAGDGQYRWFLARAVPVRGPNGDVLRWVGTCTDVHEERSRATLVRSLYEYSEALSGATTVEQVGRATCEWGRRVLGADHAIVALLGADGETLDPIAGIGVGESFVGGPMPLDTPAAICAAVRNGAVVWAGSAAERERKYPLTKGMSLEGVAGAPLRLDGHVIGSMSIGFDRPGALTEEQIQLMEAVSAQCAQAIERARLYDAERTARAEAQDANAAKARFLRMMSHDLRTPLNAILGYTDLLQGGFMGALEPRQEEALGRIRASTETMRTQIGEILEFARIEAGRIEIRAYEVPVGPVLDRVAAMLGPQANAKEIALVCEPCPADLRVRADEHRIVQVLMNLVHNAAKFTPGGGTIRMRAAQAVGRGVSLSIADTGVGIPEDKLESIFEPFVQAHEPERDGLTLGLGLGLAISRQLARAMGGDLLVESRVNGGSVFTLVLPEAAPPPELKLSA